MPDPFPDALEPGGVQPAPLPFSYQAGRAMAPDGTMLVTLQTSTPAGSQTLFMPLDFARQLAVAITEQTIGLTLPTSSLLVPS